VALLRRRFRRRPVPACGVVLACAWLGLNAYESVAHPNRFGGLGWYETLRFTVQFCAIGVVAIAALVWLVEQVFSESRS
jgi:hypothetical protein